MDKEINCVWNLKTFPETFGKQRGRPWTPSFHLDEIGVFRVVDTDGSITPTPSGWRSVDPEIN